MWQLRIQLNRHDPFVDCSRLRLRLRSDTSSEIICQVMRKLQSTIRAFGNQVVSQIEYLCTQHYDTHHSPKKKNYDTHPVHKRHSLFLPKRKSSTHIYNLFYIIFYKDFYNLTREKKSLGPDHKCSTPWPHQNHLALPGCVF